MNVDSHTLKTGLLRFQMGTDEEGFLRRMTDIRGDVPPSSLHYQFFILQ